MTILRSGPTKEYSSNWSSAFGKKKSSKASAKKGKSAKKTAKSKKASKKK